MTLSTARVMIITLTLLVLIGSLQFIRVNGVIRGGDPAYGLPCEFPAMTGRAATEDWTGHCDPLRSAVPGERDSSR